MALYSINDPTRTVKLHKKDCHWIPWDELSSCGCGETGAGGNHMWMCEEHVTRRAIDDFMRGRTWAILICHDCYEKAYFEQI